MEKLLNDLNERGVKLWLDGDKLGIRAPKEVLTAELRQSIATYKEDLLAMLRSIETPKKIPEIILRPEARYEPFPLIDVQHAYWIGRSSYLASGGVSTHLYMELEHVDMDIERLNAGLQKLIDRHDMLRAIIQSDGQQRILKEVPAYKIKTTDLRGAPLSEQESAVLQTRERMSHQVRPADRWPVFEFCATQLDGGYVCLHCSLDLLILDASSIMLLLDEWSLYYDNPAYSPPQLTLTYRDYVLAQKAWEGHEVFKKAEQYWMNRVDTLPSAPDLPLVARIEQLGKPRFVRYAHCIEKQRWSSLKSKVQKMGLTPSILLVAAFGEVLRLWSKEPEFTLNMTLFNRRPVHPEVNQMVGDFTSISLLAMHAVADELFVNRARRIQQQLSQDLENIDFSGLRVLRERGRRHGDVLKAAMPIVFTSALPLSGQDYDSVTPISFGDYVYGISQTPQVWLDHQVREEDGKLIFHWDFIEALFPDGMIKDMFDSFCQLLERFEGDDAIWNKQGCVAELPLWQQETLTVLNETRADIPVTTLHALFAAQVRTNPNALAVIADNVELTYGDLHARAVLLGHYLRDRGASKNKLIAVSVEKGWEQFVAVLGILYSGAAYLPIDPDLPQERRWHLATVGEVQIVVTQSHLQYLSWPSGTSAITFDDCMPGADRDKEINFIQTPDDLAYVLFTSGSTGQPKGVMIDHRSAANTVQDINQRFHVTKGDRLLALCELSFDLSVYDIFGVLGAGGTVVIPSVTRLHDPAHWSELIDQYRITLWNTAPQQMQIWADYLQGADTNGGESLRHAQLSGDWIPVRLPDQIRSLCPNLQVVSMGGATEASIWSIYYPIEKVDPSWKSIPYGKPLSNQHIYILNAFKEPRAMWVTGEIYIGGHGVSTGYWRDEQRTAERFITHPQTGERIYKSGDLGRYLPDGTVELFGREDFQIKIRGYRVELGEIEAALRRQSGVQDAIVNAVSNVDTGQKQLVAYIVPKQAEQNPLFQEISGIAPDVLAERRQSLPGLLALALQDYELLYARQLQIFDDASRIADRIALDVIARNFAQLGLFTQAGQQETVDSIIEKSKLDRKRYILIGVWLDILVQAGRLQKDGEAYRCIDPFVADVLDRSIEEAFASMPPSERSTPVMQYFHTCAQCQIPLLKGEQDPLELLYPGGSVDVAYGQHGRSPVSIIHNKMAADALQTLIERLPVDAPINILEIGAGVGCTTSVLLPLLPAERTCYHYTDVSQFFLEHGKQRFEDYPFVEYGLFNINQSPQSQGYPLHSFDVIVSSNTLHHAADTRRTLEYMHTLLAPGGVLLAIEVTRNIPFPTTNVGFLEGFGEYADIRREIKQPLLSAMQWQQQMEAAGFTHFCASPTPPQLYQLNVMIAEGPERVLRFQPDPLRSALLQSLPEYMVPNQYLQLDKLPLNANGKVDYKALPEPWTVERTSIGIAPRTNTEERLYALWKTALNRDGFGVDANFFELGGDSLIAISLINLARTEFQVTGLRQDDLILEFFANPTIEALALQFDNLAQRVEEIENTTPVIYEPEERTKFKEQQRGIRTFETVGQQVTLLPSSDRQWQQRLTQYRSIRHFSQSPVTLAAFSDLLHCLSVGTLHDQPKYLYPSAGGLYPIQTYVYAKQSRVEGIAGGAYYYDPKQHRLIAVAENSVLTPDAYDYVVNRPIFEEAAFSLFFVAQMAAIEPMYADKSLEFCQIEAGAIAQLLIMSAADHQVGLCSIGMVDVEKINALFALEKNHRVIFSMVGGQKRLDADQA
ncbi:MAG: amino acid adenylation domain-containing protein [Pseudomonadota bacterium]